MRQSLAFFIAQRLRKGRRRSGMLSLISVISTFSIALGIIALLVGLSAMNGFEKELKQRVLSVVPHATFTSTTGEMSYWRELQRDLLQQKQIVSATPFIQFTGLLENTSKLKAVQVKGIDPQQEQATSALVNYVAGDGWQRFASSNNSVIIGYGLAQELGVKQGDWITLMIPQTDANPRALKAPKRERIQVAGILKLSGDLGYHLALISLQDAQAYQQLGDSVTGIMLNVDDVFKAHQLISRLARQLPYPLKADSWEYSYGYMYRDIQMIRSILYIAMILVMAVACFSIVSTLIIAVKDKQRDIAILMTLGANRRLIRKIFIWYGFITGLAGSVIGTILGCIIAWQLPNLSRLFEWILGHKLLDGQIYFIDFLPSRIDWSDVVIVFITAMLLTLIASYYPAKRATRIEPAKVLSRM